MSSFESFRGAILEEVAAGKRVSSLFARATEGPTGVGLIVVVADDAGGRLLLGRCDLDDDDYPSLTPLCPEVHLFEREIAEQYGVRPKGHPWMKPVRFHRSWRPGHDAWGRDESSLPVPGVTDFFRVEGDEVHEVAVGPVHAGVIEPGHFRFQCHGEEVFHLEIALGYQHRGVEPALAGGPGKRTLSWIETVAGDTTVGHTLAYCQAVEALAGIRPSTRAEAMRGAALELERLANHTGDMGALSGDVGYLPTASFCGRIRGDFLNLTAALCGNRFGRGLIRPGGVGFDLLPETADGLRSKLELARRDVREAVDLLFGTSTVVERFEGTGIVQEKDAREIGLVGPAARASGLARDVRHDHPSGVYRDVKIEPEIASAGDVHARATVRSGEIQRSVTFTLERLLTLPEGSIRKEVGELAPDHLAVSLAEGWRGEICHVAVTDSCGRFSRYKVTDPSFHNWFGLALAMRSGQISDFPLCNKSFNLSYCGHDL
jgi:Ni,Fe-hydrogenase III large subunit